MRALAGEKVSYDTRLTSGPAQERDVRVDYLPNRDASGRVRGFVAFATDVSEIRSAERALRESERMLAESQAAAHVGSWEAMVDADGVRRALHWSDETYRIFGHEPGAVAVDHGLFLSAIHPDDRGLLWSAGKPGAEPSDRSEAEFRIVRPDGTVRTIHVLVLADRDDAGRVTRLHGTCQDITARKRAEAEGRRAREHLQVVVDATPAMIARYDAHLRLVWANKTTRAASASGPRNWSGCTCATSSARQAFAPLESATARVLAGEDDRRRDRDPLSELGRRYDALRRLAHARRRRGRGRLRRGDHRQHPPPPARARTGARARGVAGGRPAQRRVPGDAVARASQPDGAHPAAVEILRLAPSDAEASARAREVIERQVLHMKRLLDDLLDVSRVSQGKIPSTAR